MKREKGKAAGIVLLMVGELLVQPFTARAVDDECSDKLHDKIQESLTRIYPGSDSYEEVFPEEAQKLAHDFVQFGPKVNGKRYLLCGGAFDSTVEVLNPTQHRTPHADFRTNPGSGLRIACPNGEIKEKQENR